MTEYEFELKRLDEKIAYYFTRKKLSNLGGKDTRGFRFASRLTELDIMMGFQPGDVPICNIPFSLALLKKISV